MQHRDDGHGGRAAAAIRNQHTKVVMSALLANAMEFYDFVVYVFFAAYIGRAFFPPGDRFMSLIMALAVFGVGFVSRPFGAVVLGRYADRRGRRPAMLLTVGLITSATCVMALMPTYRDIGILATLVLTACRLVQGFCFGGEFGPSIAFLAEVAPARRRGLYCAGLFAGQGVAVVAAGILGTVATWWLTPEQMQDWGWRVPFLLAAAAAPVSIFLRRQMPESLLAIRGQGTTPEAGPKAGRVIALTLAILGGTVANYVCSYLPTYANVTLGMHEVASMSVSIVIGVVTCVFALLGGWLADAYDRRRVLLSSRLACAVLAVPMFAWLSANPSPPALWLTAAVLAATNAINAGALFDLMAESFAPRYRATAISIIYAMGVALFGGSTQFAVAWLGQVTASPLAPSWYLFVTSLVAFGALWPIQKAATEGGRPTALVR